MIIIRLMGGLGNQLQQYSLYRKFISLGKEAKLDEIWFSNDVQKNMKAPRKKEIDLFTGVKYETCTDRERKLLTGGDDVFSKALRKLKLISNKVYTEHTMYDPGIFDLEDSYLTGYFACENYYADIIDELKKELVLPHKERLDTVVSDIQIGTGSCGSGENKSVKTCSVHIRRGDYLDPVNAPTFGNICTDAYYDSAVKYAIEKGAGRFFVFSEDKEYSLNYVKRLEDSYGVKAVYVDENHGDDSCYDIYLMSLCDMNICANSTFSFWGARLNDNISKVMIRPTVQRNNQDFVEENMKKWWKNWVFIDKEGKVFD
ncbi:MAG: alpha-1,2-fucosyltransferase [Lachnospiraceae bacterium]|nr:alpha-1,2-fucosyltransferase [Lachnospiraceae bacterium]